MESVLNFVRNYQAVFHNGYMQHLKFPPEVDEGFRLSTVWPAVVIGCPFVFSDPKGNEVVFHCDFDFHFFNDVEHCFIHLFVYDNSMDIFLFIQVIFHSFQPCLVVYICTSFVKLFLFCFDAIDKKLFSFIFRLLQVSRDPLCPEILLTNLLILIGFQNFLLTRSYPS